MTPAPLSADMTGEKIDVPGVISVIVVVLGAAILATALSAPAYWAVAASAIFVYSDARSNAVSDSSRGFRKASPVIWLWAVSIMAIIALPWYFVVRNKRRTRHGGNAFFALVIVSAFAFVAILGRSALPDLGLQELPECDALEVTALATNALQDAPAFNGMPMNFRISTPGEVRFRSDPPRRVCRAALSSKLGNETIFYAVEWQQRKNNLIWVQILGSEDDGR